MADLSEDDTPKTASGETVISIDAMGGDEGPKAIVGGLAKALKKHSDVRFIVHGNEAELKPLLRKRPQLSERCTIVHADKTVGMEDKPSQVVRSGKDTSMWSCLESVRAGDAQVAVSCGNTGALMALSMIRLRKAPGVYRPAIAVFWPSDNPQGFNIMLDVGADIRADAPDLLKFALMGASYARNAQGLSKPRIGLLNVGTEEHKGRQELKEANVLIAEAAEANEFTYVGFVEGTDIPSDRVDLIVTDGFTGNVAIKTAEGTASLVGARLKKAFKHTPLSRLGALFALTSLSRFREGIDPRRANGGVFLGLNGTVIKSHGGADTTAFAAAVQLAIRLGQRGFTEKLAARVASQE